MRWLSKTTILVRVPWPTVASAPPAPVNVPSFATCHVSSLIVPLIARATCTVRVAACTPTSNSYSALPPPRSSVFCLSIA